MKRKASRYPGIEYAALIMLYVLSGVLLALMITGTVYTKHTLKERRAAVPVQTNPVLLLEEAPAVENNPIAELSAQQLQTADVDFDLPQLQTGGEELVNILLVGQDSASATGARSDSIILCTFNKKNDTVTLTSFLRDLYVKIPGYKSNRLNAAYSFGGIELLNKTLHENFGVEIDGNVQVDFSRFEEIIDKLGGVTMELTAAEAAFINKNIDGCALTEGTHLLNGEQALMYARDRYDVDGDFSRTGRQRKLLNVLIETYKSKKITEMLSLMQEMLPMITTDISKADLTGYALTLFPMLSAAEIRMQAIPVDGGYYDAKIGGMWVLVPDLEKNVEALSDSLA